MTKKEVEEEVEKIEEEEEEEIEVVIEVEEKIGEVGVEEIRVENNKLLFKLIRKLSENDY